MSEEAEDAVGLELDLEISTLQDKIASLKKQVQIQATSLLSADSTRQHLQDPTTRKSNPVPAPAHLRQRVLDRANAQFAYDQQCLYRTGAGVTAFKVRDPDPNAVDGGNVLGLRFEVMSKTRFLRPFYVMLHRPYPGSRHLRVHKHTVPACIPLPGLAARHLPPPPKRAAGADVGADVGADDGTSEQDLVRFARTLRREIVRYHNRASVIGDLAGAAARVAGERAEEGESQSQDESEDADALINVHAADTQAKQISLGWADGRTGRLVMDDDGCVEKIIVFRYDERDHQTRRELVASDGLRLEDIVRHVGSGASVRKRSSPDESVG